jgi:hypothetical protein
MYRLFVVYFINCYVNHNYFDWLKNQLIYVENLEAKIYIMATISKTEENNLKKSVIMLFPNEKITIECNSDNEYEYPGILKVWEIGQQNYRSNDIILYFHSKGVTHFPEYKYNKNDNYNIILKDYNKIKHIFTKYDNIDKIGYSCGGIGWCWYNFWYVRGSYIKQVEKPIKTTRRHYYEDWLFRKVKTEEELYCDYERPYSYYENTLMSCYSFYKDSIHWSLGSYWDAENWKYVQIFTPNMYLFDWIRYLQMYPELKISGINSENSAIQHWKNYGIAEGKNARMYIFDWQFYLNTYPELKNININTEEQAKNHWLVYGIDEGRYINKYYINYIDYND